MRELDEELREPYITHTVALANMYRERRMRLNPDRRYRLEGMILCPAKKRRGMNIALVPFPQVHTIVTHQFIKPRQPPAALVMEVNKANLMFNDVLGGEHLGLQELSKRIWRDEIAALKLSAEECKSFQPEARIGTDSGEIRIEQRNCDRIVTKVIEAEHIFSVLPDGRMTVYNSSGVPIENFGYDPNMLLHTILRMAQEYGYYDYSRNTPPVPIMSAHTLKAMQNAN